jgi:ABC-type nitrate/sulfonate/bicarbonate transport system substrate-binding protein
MDHRRFGRSVLMAGLAMSVIGLTATTALAQSKPKPKVQTVRLLQASGADFTDADVYEAIHILKAEGIKVILSEINDPATALRAIIAGQGDVYMDAPDTVALAVQGGATNVRYIGSMYRTSAYDILALPNFTLNNLSGATLAIASPGSAGQVAAVAALTKLGVNVSTIQQVTVGGTSARVTAILAGQVDLAPALAPSAIPAVATGKVKILVNTGQVLGAFLQQGLIANTKFIKNKQLAQKVVTAFISAERWASSNEAQYAAMANKNQLQGSLTASDEVEAWAQLKEANFWATNGALCQPAINATLNLDYSSGALTKSTMPAQNKWIDTEFVRAYLKAHHQSVTTC